MIETSGRTNLKPATNQTLRPGDFPLGSQKSRAAARALLQERNQPIPPPWGTIDLSSLTVESARNLYAKLSALPDGQMLGTGWFPIRWPNGFIPCSGSTVGK